MALPSAAPTIRSHYPRHAFSWFLLILANILWAASYVAAKFALRDTSLNIMLALRMGIAALILLPLLIARRRDLRLTRQSLPQFLILALVGFVINKLLEYGGLALTTASDVALLIASESIFTAILSWVLLRERFKPSNVASVPTSPLVVVSGASLAIFSSSWLCSSRHFTRYAVKFCSSNIHPCSSLPPLS